MTFTFKLKLNVTVTVARRRAALDRYAAAFNRRRGSRCMASPSHELRNEPGR